MKTAPIGPDGENALHAAARIENLKIVYELLKSNVNVNQLTTNDFQVFDSLTMSALVPARFADMMNSNGFTALHLAAEHEHLKILKCLLNAETNCKILAYKRDEYLLAKDLALRYTRRQRSYLELNIKTVGIDEV